MEKVDVLIIGAGPAGSSCAAHIADAGFNVVMVERRRAIGEPVQCAEYIPKLLLRELEIKKNFISNEISSMKIFIDFREYDETKSPGYLIDRVAFDRALCLDAIRKGARILIGAKAEAIKNGSVSVKTKSGEKTFKPIIIVGADGPLSTVGRWINSRNQSFVNSYQAEILKERNMKSTEIYFFKECPGGYGWVFPKGDTLNVGVGTGIRFKKNPQGLLQYFLDKLHLDKRYSVRLTKGLIPVGGILDTIVKDNVLLIGDAAGLTHPITGAGIPQAIISGRTAGKVIVKSLQEKENSILGEYNRETRKLWGEYISRAHRKREILKKIWGKTDIKKIVKQTWVAFKEYYETGDY